ncbi:hypothetical protein SDC9_117835 [bioreactor metagenome]|uniref:Uncharacterized protein n=1 Tax=bioreactor metagenome TaxID=1076179 RepID=A0A645C8K9_9ZZZZ
MVPTDTKGSNPAIIIVVVTKAVKAIVSSAIPKLVPPRDNKNIKTGIKINSFPFKLATTFPIPASKAPVFVVTPKKPPINRTKMAISIASCNPAMGAITKSAKVAFLTSGMKYVAIAIIAVMAKSTV